MPDTRTERDSMGEMQVPADAYYGASTQRAALNFPISTLRFSRPFIRVLGLIKLAAAKVNEDLGLLDDLCETMLFRGFCPLVDGAVSPIASTLKHFRDEYEAHIAQRRCPVTGKGPGALAPTEVEHGVREPIDAEAPRWWEPPHGAEPRAGPRRSAPRAPHALPPRAPAHR